MGGALQVLKISPISSLFSWSQHRISVKSVSYTNFHCDCCSWAPPSRNSRAAFITPGCWILPSQVIIAIFIYLLNTCMCSKCIKCFIISTSLNSLPSPLRKGLWDGRYHYPQFSDDDSEAQTNLPKITKVVRDRDRISITVSLTRKLFAYTMLPIFPSSSS